MGKNTTAAEFVLTANNRTGVAFGQLGASFRQAKADAERYSAAANRAGRAGAGGAGGRAGGGGSMLGGMGRFLAPAAAFAGVRSIMQMGDEIGDQADSMQVSAETFQTLQVLARDTSVSLGGLGKAFASLNEKKVDALADETSAAAQAFQKLNLAKPLFAMNAEELFEAVSATMRDTSSSASQLAAAQDLLGQSATKLMPVYQALAGTSLAELNKQFVESGRIIDEHGIKKISEMESKYQAAADRMKTLGMKTLIGVDNGIEELKQLNNKPGQFAQHMGEYAMQWARERKENPSTSLTGRTADFFAPAVKVYGAGLGALGDFLNPRAEMAPNWSGFARNDVQGPQALAAQDPSDASKKLTWYAPDGSREPRPAALELRRERLVPEPRPDALELRREPLVPEPRPSALELRREPLVPEPRPPALELRREPLGPARNGPIEVKPDNRRLETLMERQLTTLQAIERKPEGSVWK